MQIFYKIKYDLKGHSWSQIMTFLIKNSPSLLFMLLIDWRNKCRWTLWKNKVWIIQRQHLPCFDLNLRSYGQLFVLVFYIFWFVQYVLKRIFLFCICDNISNHYPLFYYFFFKNKTICKKVIPVTTIFIFYMVSTQNRFKFSNKNLKASYQYNSDNNQTKNAINKIISFYLNYKYFLLVLYVLCKKKVTNHY